MSDNSNKKKAVRALMARTGQNYTQALSQLKQEQQDFLEQTRFTRFDMKQISGDLPPGVSLIEGKRGDFVFNGLNPPDQHLVGVAWEVPAGKEAIFCNAGFVGGASLHRMQVNLGTRIRGSGWILNAMKVGTYEFPPFWEIRVQGEDLDGVKMFAMVSNGPIEGEPSIAGGAQDGRGLWPHQVPAGVLQQLELRLDGGARITPSVPWLNYELYGLRWELKSPLQVSVSGQGLALSTNSFDGQGAGCFPPSRRARVQWPWDPNFDLNRPLLEGERLFALCIVHQDAVYPT